MADPSGHKLMLHQMAPERLKALEAQKAKAAAPKPTATPTRKAARKPVRGKAKPRRTARRGKAGRRK